MRKVSQFGHWGLLAEKLCSRGVTSRRQGIDLYPCRLRCLPHGRGLGPSLEPLAGVGEEQRWEMVQACQWLSRRTGLWWRQMRFGILTSRCSSRTSTLQCASIDGRVSSRPLARGMRYWATGSRAQALVVSTVGSGPIGASTCFAGHSIIRSRCGCSCS